jgi:hypothetical protein
MTASMAAPAPTFDGGFGADLFQFTGVGDG